MKFRIILLLLLCFACVAIFCSKAEKVSGPQGIPGQQGLPGIDGKDGQNGSDGIDGANGTNGTNGMPGPGTRTVYETILDGSGYGNISIPDISVSSTSVMPSVVAYAYGTVFTETGWHRCFVFLTEGNAHIRTGRIISSMPGATCRVVVMK